jgi:hypothetical protein
MRNATKTSDTSAGSKATDVLQDVPNTKGLVKYRKQKHTIDVSTKPSQSTTPPAHTYRGKFKITRWGFDQTGISLAR